MAAERGASAPGQVAGYRGGERVGVIGRRRPGGRLAGRLAQRGQRRVGRPRLGTAWRGAGPAGSERAGHVPGGEWTAPGRGHRSAPRAWPRTRRTRQAARTTAATASTATPVRPLHRPLSAAGCSAAARPRWRRAAPAARCFRRAAPIGTAGRQRAAFGAGGSSDGRLPPCRPSAPPVRARHASQSNSDGRAAAGGGIAPGVGPGSLGYWLDLPYSAYSAQSGQPALFSGMRPWAFRPQANSTARRRKDSPPYDPTPA